LGSSHNKTDDPIISYYTFFWVNADTVAIAPDECVQFGRAMWRIIKHLKHANPNIGPIYMSKIGIADGFYRIWVRAEDIPKLGMLFPSRPGDEPLVGFPLTLPMGWKESPKIFTAATETVADLAKQQIQQGPVQPPHRLQDISEQPPPNPPTPCPVILPAFKSAISPCLVTLPALKSVKSIPPPKNDTAMGTPCPVTLPALKSAKGVHYHRPLSLWDVYVDDFLGLVQGSKARRRSVKNAMLHALDSVLRPLDAEDSAHRQEPASLKKMSKGDATWTMIKKILGWILDTINRTISLPAHRRERIVAILDSVSPTQKRISLKKWQQILGELRSMAIAIPAAIGLFYVLQAALKNKTTDGQRVRLTRHTHAFLEDFRWLSGDVASRPTNIAEIVPDVVPSTRGACDASKKGMDGVHFVPANQGPLIPLLWRASWPLSVQQRLVSHHNPTGNVNNSELELAASVAHLDVLAQNVDVWERTVQTMLPLSPGNAKALRPPSVPSHVFFVFKRFINAIIATFHFTTLSPALSTG
jgi:hypothetical protein